MDRPVPETRRFVSHFLPTPGTCLVFTGKGNNGGDALVAAEQLQRIGWKIDIRMPFLEENCGELTQKKLKALCESAAQPADTIDRAPYTLILDGLLGTGAKSFLREPIRS